MRATEPTANARDVLLARAWLHKGRIALAREHVQRVLASNPDDGLAHRYLAYCLVHDDELRAAYDHLTIAAAAHPSDEVLRREIRELGELIGLPAEAPAVPDHPDGKLRFRYLFTRDYHRSGWGYALRAVRALHNAGGVRFEPFVEEPFAWEHPRGGVRAGPELLWALRSGAYGRRLTSEERAIIPIREPWIGVLHNPHDMPSWFQPAESPRAIFAKPVWRESVEHCVGLFALSHHLGSWMRETIGRPVSVLRHPTESPQIVFDFDRFVANPRRSVVQVGWWLRSPSAIHRLHLSDGGELRYRKVWLLPRFSSDAERQLRELRDRECRTMGYDSIQGAGGVEELSQVSDEAYDELLAENVVFVQLLAASACNTVVECIARATPILINPHPAVREYLGEDYPLYYDDLRDAARRVQDRARVRAAHEHLRASRVRDELSAEHFRASFEASEVYGLL